MHDALMYGVASVGMFVTGYACCKVIQHLGIFILALFGLEFYTKSPEDIDDEDEEDLK